MRVVEMVCTGYEKDRLGTIAVFHTVVNKDTSVSEQEETFYVPIKDKKEFLKDQHILAHFSYRGITITNMEGDFLKQIRL